MRIEYGAATTANPGVGNTGNEDAFLLPGASPRQGECTEDGAMAGDSVVLFAVSDGIHCSPRAAQASRALLEALAASHAMDPAAPVGRKLADVNDRFVGLVGDDRRAAGMTATLAAAEILGSRVTVYHVGDSMAWLVRDGTAERLTPGAYAARAHDRRRRRLAR